MSVTDMHAIFCFHRDFQLRKQNRPTKKRKLRNTKSHKQLEEATALKAKIEEVTVVLKAKTGENGKLFGSVTTSDVAHELKMTHHIVVDKKKISMDAIKSVGTVQANVKLHPGVAATLKVKVEEM